MVVADRKTQFKKNPRKCVTITKRSQTLPMSDDLLLCRYVLGDCHVAHIVVSPDRIYIASLTLLNVTCVVAICNVPGSRTHITFFWSSIVLSKRKKLLEYSVITPTLSVMGRVLNKCVWADNAWGWRNRRVSTTVVNLSVYSCGPVVVVIWHRGRVARVRAVYRRQEVSRIYILIVYDDRRTRNWKSGGKSRVCIDTEHENNLYELRG